MPPISRGATASVGDERLRERAGRFDERSRTALDDDRAEHAHAGSAGTVGVHAHEPTRGRLPTARSAVGRCAYPLTEPISNMG